MNNLFKALTFTSALAAVAIAAPPSVPTTPQKVRDIIHVQPFQLTEGYEYAWRAEKPLLTEGYLVVLKVHPEFVFPRQQAEPVLFAGDETVERINVGYTSGMVVGVIPGTADLSTTPIWFGAPALPEQTDAAKIAAEKTAAVAKGVTPFEKAKIDAATAGRAAPITFADREALRCEAAKLVRQFAPDEIDLANSISTCK